MDRHFEFQCHKNNVSNVLSFIIGSLEFDGNRCKPNRKIFVACGKAGKDGLKFELFQTNGSHFWLLFLLLAAELKQPFSEPFSLRFLLRKKSSKGVVSMGNFPAQNFGPWLTDFPHHNWTVIKTHHRDIPLSVLVGFWAMAYYNPYINGLYNPLIPYIQANNQVPLVIAQLPLTKHGPLLGASGCLDDTDRGEGEINNPPATPRVLGERFLTQPLPFKTEKSLLMNWRFFFGAKKKNDKNWGDGWLLIQIIQDAVFHLFVVHVQQKRLVRLTEICWTVDFCEVYSGLRKPRILYTYDI